VIRRDLSTFGRPMTTALILGIAAAMAVLAWFGYRAAREWRRSSELLEERRTEHAADLFVRALVRDMRGVEAHVLRGLDAHQITLDEPHDLSDVVAGAFARYPYPEAFFAWETQTPPAEILFFTRADRRPSWLPLDAAPEPFPVTVVRHEPSARLLFERMTLEAAHGQRFAIFQTTLDGTPYQVVARLIYRTSRRDELDRVFGFLVNLDWVRATYLAELTPLLGRIAATGEELAVAILDDEGRLLAGTPEAIRSERAAVRSIRPLFCDPALLVLDPEGREIGEWTIRVAGPGGAARALAVRGADVTITVTTIAAITLGFGLLLTGRALRASADLAKVRSDFVATVTHELKTPLATLRVVGETLSRGRITSRVDIREYAQLVDQEAKRLSRLVDNLLAYSRVTDVSEVYSFEPLAVADLIDDLLRGFLPQLNDKGFELSVDIPADLAALRGDRTALVLAFDNLLDNAMRYSGESRWIGIRASQADGRVLIEFSDRGVGIPEAELAQVVRRFVRGSNAASHGSGLGLPIVSRIVKDHGGLLRVDSAPQTGTTVSVMLPLMDDKG
jgi:signal transduction histidine kinase